MRTKQQEQPSEKLMSGSIDITQLVNFISQIPIAFSQPTIEAATIDEIITSSLQKKQRTKSKKPTSFHPSSIINGCIVKEVFKRTLSEWEEPQLEADKLRIMEAGNGTHDWMQSKVLSYSSNLFGTWVCKHCRKESLGRIPEFRCRNVVTVGSILASPEETTRTSCFDVLLSDQMPWEYKELKIYDPATNISGRLDGIIINDGKWYILELKSTADDILNNVRRVKKEGKMLLEEAHNFLPFAHHLDQASLYTTIIINRYAKDWGLDPDKCGGYIVTYVSRDTYKTRSFRVKPNQNAYVFARDKIDTINELVERNQPLAGQKKCRDRNDTYAKECPFRLHCFPYKNKKVTNV